MHPARRRRSPSHPCGRPGGLGPLSLRGLSHPTTAFLPDRGALCRRGRSRSLSLRDGGDRRHLSLLRWSHDLFPGHGGLTGHSLLGSGFGNCLFRGRLALAGLGPDADRRLLPARELLLSVVQHPGPDDHRRRGSRGQPAHRVSHAPRPRRLGPLGRPLLHCPPHLLPQRGRRLLGGEVSYRLHDPPELRQQPPALRARLQVRPQLRIHLRRQTVLDQISELVPTLLTRHRSRLPPTVQLPARSSPCLFRAGSPPADGRLASWFYGHDVRDRRYDGRPT